ncbi:S1 family peptidase [Terrabacter sp. MAHUQ-38]|uniref:S1 family peptidase n=1 Tax=unclassified Terrabacter TaxID=2630222 RepID=UPI00165E2FFA|nr:S1 family peptidase [Terrabacter sp. MAHUQ-38]MBC9821293.1 serine protease [Terrabacter sp. MAHUQ-38]
MTRSSLTALAATAAIATAITAMPAQASILSDDTPSPQPRASTDAGLSVAEMAAHWLAADRGISLPEARERVDAQDGQARTATSLERLLGRRAAGSYIDAESGALVVNVVDTAAGSTVRAAGATAKVVERSTAQLASAQRSARARAGSDVVSSYADPVTNQVVLTVPTARVSEVRADVAGLDGVTVKGTNARATTQANVYGGQQIEFNGYVCSLGFNATRGGSQVFITAGHCGEGYQTFRKNGTTLGTTQAYSFPGNDYAYSSLTSGWTGIGAVDLYNGLNARRVTGYSNAPVGTAVCKSGRTTGWTCGSVQARNVTVNYTNADGSHSTVGGLTQSNTCTEGGDSGGSWMASTTAQGVTSGGAGYGPNAVCGQKVGQPNVAYFQPVGEIISAYGLTLKTS